MAVHSATLAASCMRISSTRTAAAVEILVAGDLAMHHGLGALHFVTQDVHFLTNFVQPVIHRSLLLDRRSE